MKNNFTLKTRALTVASIVLFAMASLTSCIYHVDNYGRDGRDGLAYFGIDYDYTPIYSYWDNNPSVPNDPWFGEFYRTAPGIYEFEYFINPYEYWYGTYDIRINRGENGGPNYDGADGADSFLTLICNGTGFYFDQWDDCGCDSRSADGELTFEKFEGNSKFTVTMRKGHINERPAKGIPKFKGDPTVRK